MCAFLKPGEDFGRGLPNALLNVCTIAGVTGEGHVHAAEHAIPKMTLPLGLVEEVAPEVPVAKEQPRLAIGGALAGIAGASLSIGLLNIFQENMTNGLGFIAVALVYFGGWRPVGVLLGALLFSTVNALQLWMQLLSLPIPSDLAVMLPYILTILALALAMRQVQQPAALTKPYERGE